MNELLKLANEMDDQAKRWSLEAGDYAQGRTNSFCEAASAIRERHAELCRAAPAGGDAERGKNDPSWSLFDRVDFALRDAGFDLDEAANIAALASGSAPAGSGEELAKLVEGARDYATGGNVRPDDGDEDQEQWDRLTEAAALLRKLQQGAESFVSCTCHEERQKALCLNKHRCVRAYPLASQGQEGGTNG